MKNTMNVVGFDIDQIMRSGQCFRIRKVADGKYVAIHLDNYLEIEVKEDGRYIMKCSPEELERIWIPYFDLRTNYEMFGQMINPGDEFLKKAYEYGQGIRILRQDLWEAMVQFITSQRNNIPRITSTIEKLCEKYGERHEAAGVEFYTIPTPKQLAEADLEGLRERGLYYRAEYLKELAENITSGKINLEELKSIRDFAQVHNRLLSIKGIGPKVASCIELFGLHRMDALPVDVWMQRIISQKYGGYFPAEQYRGREGLMQQYMFFYAINHKEEFKEEGEQA